MNVSCVSPSQRQIESIEDWVGVWQNQQGMRERLFAMATFWNESSQEERHTVFSRFLAVISGSGKGVTGEDFPAEQMVCLPMDNYEDLTHFSERYPLVFFSHQARYSRDAAEM